MPNRLTKNQPLRRRDSMTDHAAWGRFCEYNISDVRTETAILRRLQKYPVPEAEWRLYHLDQRINDRGMPVDVDFCEQAIVMAGRRTQEHVARAAPHNRLEQSEQHRAAPPLAARARLSVRGFAEGHGGEGTHRG
jgi:hypothetical protein